MEPRAPTRTFVVKCRVCGKTEADGVKFDHKARSSRATDIGTCLGCRKKRGPKLGSKNRPPAEIITSKTTFDNYDEPDAARVRRLKELVGG